MSRQYSLPDMFPPVVLLAPAADAAGRTSAYRTLKGASKAWIVAHLNQGNAATILLSPLQAQDVSGTGSKAINATRVWLNDATATSDVLVAQANGATFTTDANVADKLVIFEVIPETVLDMANGFKTIGISTGASNAANITEAKLIVWERYQGADKISTYAN